MKNRAVWAWLVALALGATIAFVQFRDSSSETDGDGHSPVASNGARMLFPAPIEEVGAIEIVYAGQLHRFERDAKSAWLYHLDHPKTPSAHQHQSVESASEMINKALTGFGRTRLERQVPADKQRDSYGVNSPQMIVLIYGLGGTELLAQYAVGQVAPDTFSRYITRVGSDTVHTIANFHIELLEKLIAEMQKLSAVPATNSSPGTNQ
jgi:hypothetical protein